MSMLVVGAVTVPVSPQTLPKKEFVEYGDFSQAIDGSDGGVLVGRKVKWTVSTAPMTQATADTLVAAIQATPPVSCSGTLTGSLSARGTVTSYDTVTVKGGFRVIVTFTLLQV